jgi:D-alanine transaminase
MSRIAYVNGRYQAYGQAGVHIDDRGYQFADGVYEVMAVVDGRLPDEILHLSRLDRSLAELAIALPMSRPALRHVVRETIRRNRLRSGIVYLQITRGVARRDHPFPPHAIPSLVVTARRLKGPPASVREAGVAVITLPDIRWKRRDIKSISLLPNVLAKQAAREQQAYEAWLVNEQGTITEGSSTNAWIVSRDGWLITHPADHDILGGITRTRVLTAARQLGVVVQERPFTRDEALAAKEAFLTSTTSHVLPVVSIDGKPIGNGHPGEITLALLAHYLSNRDASKSCTA